MHEQLVLALIARAAALFEITLDPRQVDRKLSLFAEEGFRLGGYEFDSMDLAQMMVAFEEDLQIPILDEAVDLTDIATLDKLASVLLERADPERLKEFCLTWLPVA